MRLFVVLLTAVLSASVLAEYGTAATQNVPVDRLATNLSRLAKEQPRDLEVRVNLARVYAMAYAQKRDEMPVLTREPARWQPSFRAGMDLEYQQFEVKTSGDPKIRAVAA